MTHDQLSEGHAALADELVVCGILCAICDVAVRRVRLICCDVDCHSIFGRYVWVAYCYLTWSALIGCPSQCALRSKSRFGSAINLYGYMARRVAHPFASLLWMFRVPHSLSAPADKGCVASSSSLSRTKSNGDTGSATIILITRSRQESPAPTISGSSEFETRTLYKNRKGRCTRKFHC